jgi:NAD(P)-dependent dehydrogenase (short-subunit alcohol dehydrogenase family)
MAGKLEGRRMVITGISRGIGLETARRFLPEGAEILGVARDAPRLEKAARELAQLSAGRLSTLVCDLGVPGGEETIAAAVAKRWGSLDVLINNAAIMLHSSNGRGLLSEGPDALERTMALNLMAPFRLARALVPSLERGREPRIIHVSSGAGTFAGMREFDIAGYRLSKWALNGLTMLMAHELSGRIAVNALDPGWVKTDLGGPNAPGSPVESAEGAFALVTAPFSETGKLWKSGREIPF